MTDKLSAKGYQDIFPHGEVNSWHSTVRSIKEKDKMIKPTDFSTNEMQAHPFCIHRE